VTARDLYELIALRDAQDSLTRAIGWTVLVYHVDFPERITLYGYFPDPAPAMVWATRYEPGLNEEGETGFRCVPVPIMPAGES
jgi:hypothetical protein